MSLNNIRLNSTLLTTLYKTSLVDGAEIRKADKRSFIPALTEPLEPRNTGPHSKDLKRVSGSARDWDYLGDYKKNILLIVRYPDVPYLPDHQLNFLTSILSACKLSLADVAIQNLSNAPATTYKTISDQFCSRVTVLFGITPEEFAMPVNFPEFQVQALNNCTFLHTPMLEHLEADKILKSKLWVCLRRIFDLP